MNLWYVIQTKPKKEEEARSYLSTKGVEVFNPLIENFLLREGRMNMIDGYTAANYTYNFMASPSAWEYKWILQGELSPRIMNNLGRIGWEFVGTLGGEWAIFKKMLPDEALENEAS